MLARVFAKASARACGSRSLLSSSLPQRPASTILSKRWLSTSDEDDPRKAPRDVMEYDVLVVGAGPSGLSAAIRLKQLATQAGKDLSVCVIEKGAEVGAHILSGACIEPRSLNELIPDWKEKGAPLNTPAIHDEFRFLTETRSFRLPNPPQMHNEGNYIVSLGDVVRWLGAQAEEAGIEIFPGFAGAEVLYDSSSSSSLPRVAGVATGDVGIAKDGSLKDSFARGVELRAKQTIFAEGCRGSLTKTLFEKLQLRKECQPQTYALGIKEVWEIDPAQHKKGFISHSIGWPMDPKTYGGSWMYHFDENKVSVGFVVSLDYWNTNMTPYLELQKFKTHPSIRPTFEGGNCISYGARTLSEGGLQSIPQLTFPGGLLVGDTAGFLNTPKIKGTHTAMKSGMIAAEACFEAIESNAEEARSYSDLFKKSWLYEELHAARNARPAFKWGLYAGLAINAVDTFLFRGKAPFTLSHAGEDWQHRVPASQCPPIEYPKPDNVLTFDLLTNLARSGTNHEHDQPAHLKLRDPTVPTRVNLPIYDGPEGRFCPAKVYEYVPDGEEAEGKKKLQINAQNCLHCKACDIRDPNIDWTVPEGGGGPAYGSM